MAAHFEAMVYYFFVGVAAGLLRACIDVIAVFRSCALLSSSVLYFVVGTCTSMEYGSSVISDVGGVTCC